MDTFAAFANWIYARPIFSLISGIVAVLGYFNIYLFGFLLNVPVALRPFLDSYFFSTLALEFVLSVAVSLAVARILYLLMRLILSNFPLKISSILGGMDVLGFGSGSFEEYLDRYAKVSLKLIARWMRRKRVVVGTVLTIATFAIAFLGWHALWFVPACIVMLPLCWLVVSRVELRREFATFKNTKHLSRDRVYRAFFTFSLVYLALCVFLAGVASFAERLDTKVSVAIDGQAKSSSLLAVTASGVLVGDQVGMFSAFAKPFSVTAYFIPFDALESVGQQH